jgi:endoglucanase
LVEKTEKIVYNIIYFYRRVGFMNTEMILRELAECQSVSGFEYEFCQRLKGMMSSLCDDVRINRFNSVICHRKSKKENSKKLMIEAHLDQIGLMVKEIDDMGHIKFLTVGGIDKRILPGAEVYINGKEKVYGVIGSKPPHLKESADKEKMPDVDELLIDTGYSKEEIEKKISVGDSVLLKSSFDKMAGGNFCSLALDNRAGIAAVIYSAMETKDTDFDIYYVFTSEEELGLHGAYSSAKEIKPDLAIVVDVTHGMTNDSKDEAGVFKLGSGAIVCKGPGLNGELTDKIIETAEKNNIKYDTEVVSGHSGTNAWAVQKACGNCKTALISIPLKYMHTSVEMINISDVDAVSQLLKLISEEGIENA